MKIINQIITILIFINFNPIFAQKAQIDSLLKSLQIAENDTNKIKILLQIGERYEGIKPDSVIFFYKKACILAQNKIKDSLIDTKNYQKLLAKGFNLIAIEYAREDKFPISIDYYQKALKIYEKLENKEEISECLTGLAIVNTNLGNLDKALEFYYDVIKIKAEISDSNGLARCFYGMGNIYYELSKYDLALENYNKTLNIAEKTGNIMGISFCLNNIGNIHYVTEKYSVALEYYLKSLKIKEQLGDNKGIATTNICIGMTNTILGMPDKAITYHLKALETGKEIRALSIVKEAYKGLSDAYESLNNLSEALKYFKLFKNTNDSIYNSESSKQINEMQTKYETEKKEQQIEIQNIQLEKKDAENKKQRTLIFSFLAGFIIILIFSIFLYRLFIQKKKANIIIARKNQSLEIAFAEINTQKEEITAQRDQIEEQRDKLSDQNHILFEQKKEITDSINYAKRIQNAVLPDDEHLQQILSDYFILFRPKDIVSGDFYWATIIKNWQIFAVADCTGHGVPGAFMSMLGVSFLNEIVRKEDVSQANHILNNLRLRIIESLKQKGISGEQKDGMDIAICVINLENNILQYSGANNPLWMVRNNKNLTGFQNLSGLEEVKPDKMPIAIYERMDDFTNHETQLQTGDTIYLMSDGYEDQFGGTNFKKFLSKNLKQLLLANCLLTMEEQKQILEKTLVEWIGEGEQIDDITILGLKL